MCMYSPGIFTCEIHMEWYENMPRFHYEATVNHGKLNDSPTCTLPVILDFYHHSILTSINFHQAHIVVRLSVRSTNWTQIPGTKLGAFTLCSTVDDLTLGIWVGTLFVCARVATWWSEIFLRILLNSKNLQLLLGLVWLYTVRFMQNLLLSKKRQTVKSLNTKSL